jgi:hypothetical protein
MMLVTLSFYQVCRMFVILVIEKLGLVNYSQINEVGKAESRLSFFHNGFRDSYLSARR